MVTTQARERTQKNREARQTDSMALVDSQQLPTPVSDSEDSLDSVDLCFLRPRFDAARPEAVGEAVGTVGSPDAVSLPDAAAPHAAVVQAEVGFENYPVELRPLAARTSEAVVHGDCVYVRRADRAIKAVMGNDCGKKMKFTQADAEWLCEGRRSMKRPVRTRAQCDQFDKELISELARSQKKW